MRTYDVAELAVTLFEESGDALFLFNPETEQIIETNPMAQRLSGYSRQQLLQFQILYLFRSEAAGGVQKLRNAFRKTGLFHSQEGFLLRHQAEGAWIPVNLTITRLHTEQETLGLITARDLREQREAQRQIAHREAELERVLASVADCLWSAHIDVRGKWNWNYCSPVIEQVTGKPTAFFATGADAFLQIVTLEDRPRLERIFRALRQGLIECDEELRIIHSDGSERWVRWAIRAKPEGAGGQRLDGVLTDISDRKSTEEMLRASETKYRDLVETSNDLIWSVDAEGRWTFVNRNAAREIYGYEAEEMLGRRFLKFLAPEVVQRDLDLFAQILQGKPAFHHETIHIRKDGERVHLSFNAIMQRDAQGNILGTTGTATNITHMKLAERALRESEHRFHQFMSNNPALAFLKDAEGRMLYVNKAVEKAFGIRAEDWVGKTDFEVLPIDVAEQIRANDQAILAGNQPVELIERIPTPDGRLREWFALKFPLLDSSGNRMLAGMAVDQTDRREAEVALRDSEERYRLLFERNLAGVFRSMPDGRLIDCNESYARMLGCANREEALKHRTTDFYLDPADRAAFLEEMREQRLLTNYELRLRRLDGTPLWVLINASMLADDEGRAMLEGTFFDITERKFMEGAMRASEAKYRTLIEHLEQSVYLKSRELRYLAVNHVFCQPLGLTEEQVVGRTDNDLFSRELAAKLRAEDNEVLTLGKTLHTEEQTQVGGRPRMVRSVKSPVKDDRGQITGVLGITWDVTDHQSLEAQLRHVQKMDAIGQLAGGVAHDFNNLLTVILGNLSYALTRCQLPGDQIELLRNAEQAGMRAAELTQRLLGFSRSSMLRAEPYDLNQAVEETVRFLRPTIDPRIELLVRPFSGLWPVKADPGLLNQVLMNLSLNARDAMPIGGKLLLETANFTPGPEYLRNHLEARSGDFVRLRVQDTGQGMTDEVRQRIFEPFFTTKDKGKGTGLGLATVFGIVRQHNGWITCDSHLGRGATFDVYLPRHNVSALSAPKPAPSPIDVGTETILLVDDEPMIRNLGSLVLRRFGYKVLLAEDGQKALDLYRADPKGIDLVILDGTMPRLSGRDALKEMIRINPEARVLFSSGYSAEHLDLLDFPQIVGFMHKPYRVDDLAARVRVILDKARKPG